jgi:hypothetical protein
VLLLHFWRLQRKSYGKLQFMAFDFNHGFICARLRAYRFLASKLPATKYAKDKVLTTRNNLLFANNRRIYTVAKFITFF